MSHDRRRSEQDVKFRHSHVGSHSSQNGGYSRSSPFSNGDCTTQPNSQNITSAYLSPVSTHRTLLRERTKSRSRSNATNLSDYANVKYLPWSRRMKHVTWAYFTLTMATGGIANVISAVPFRFHGLYTIGLVFFLLNLVLYIMTWIMILTRFYLYPHAFWESLTHPTESLFVPAFAVSFGTILLTVIEYGADHAGVWLTKTVLVMFWFDCGLAIILSLTIYMILWSTTSFTIAQMTPIWIFPAYPLLIMGPHAANLSARLSSPNSAIQVIVGGFTIQGIGFLVALTIYSSFVYRLMTEKLPAERLRPGMFVSVGPSAFTVSGTIGMAANLHRTIATKEYFMDVPGLLAAQILRLVANWMSLWLWGLAIWFFFVSLVSNMSCFRPKHHLPFAMTWFSFVFPQTALVTATFSIAQAFDVQTIRIIGCIMAILLVMVWIFVVFMMIRAIIRKDILWPEKGEDKSEGGFKSRDRPEDEEDGGSIDVVNGDVSRPVNGEVNGTDREDDVGKTFSDSQSSAERDLSPDLEQKIAMGEYVPNRESPEASGSHER